MFLLLSFSAFAGKIQNADVKSLAELTAGGATKAQLINDTKIYVSTNNINDTLSNAIANGQIGGGSGSNIIADFENQSLSAWSPFKDAAATHPVDLIGGSPDAGVTYAVTNSGPLNGNWSFLMTKGAANYQGNGDALTFAVPLAYRGFQVQICYNASTGGSYAANDALLSVYSVTDNSTDALLSAQGVEFFNVGAGPACMVVSTTTHTTSVRIAPYISSTSTLAWILKLDNISWDFTKNIAVSPISDWEPCTPTFSAAFGTISSLDAKCKREGDTFRVRGRAISTTPTSGIPYITFPAIYNIKHGDANGTTVGNFNTVFSGGAGSDNNGTVITDSTDPTRVCFAGIGSGQANATACTMAWSTVFTSSGSAFTFEFSVPSTNLLSGNTFAGVTNNSGRQVSVQAYGNASPTISANNPIPFITFADNTNSWSGTTFTVPDTGKYTLDVSVAPNAVVAGEIQLWKGGVYYRTIYYNPANSAIMHNSITENFLQGELLTIRCPTTITLTNNQNYHFLNITKLNPSNLIFPNNAPIVQGYSGNGIDTFSVNYGTTNATTVCSATPCSYLDQIGNSVSSITRSGTGAYSVNSSRTYSKFKCMFTAGSIVAGSTTSCSNCNALNFSTTADSYGTLLCQGAY